MGIVAGVRALRTRLRRNSSPRPSQAPYLRVRSAALSPPLFDRNERVQLQDANVDTGDVVSITDSTGKRHHGVLVNKQSSAAGIEYDLLEDPEGA